MVNTAAGSASSGPSIRPRFTLSGVGPVEPSDSVYVVRDAEEGTLGFLFATDTAGALHLISLTLSPRTEGGWRATVKGVVSQQGREFGRWRPLSD